ncbi:Protein arginine N-methyltransferase 7 [Liparis tanakae]|uniref:Protein arginine N-methyltransferase 7 n=1 Tax=Liparis tanakae TaxID=230148 RepID=A0A4Z2ENP3_9TELE|nr:Protein arginine N-methyltransferase 7 [Liparis tanakae]
MKTFCGGTDPNTGAPDRPEDSEEYDYHQEIARYPLPFAPSRVRARAWMLRLRLPGVGELRSPDGSSRTSITSCFADMLHDSDRVFRPMAEAARLIVEKNGFSEKIKIINKHSTQVTVGTGEAAPPGHAQDTQGFDLCVCV